MCDEPDKHIGIEKEVCIQNCVIDYEVKLVMHAKAFVYVWSQVQLPGEMQRENLPGVGIASK